MDLFELWGTIGIRTADAFNQIDQVQNRVNGLAQNMGTGLQNAGAKMTAVGQGAQNMGASMSAGVSAPILAIGVAAGKMASDVQNSTSKISSALGMTKKEAEELSKVSQALWKDGFGESLEEVDAALVNVKQNMAGISGDKELKAATKNAMILAQTFDADINEVTRAGNNLMENFGISSEKAFDMMTKGAQDGLNFSNEMFDNLAEYAPLWSDMGYSAEEMFGILKAGAKDGVYNLDYVNDVMKEFQIRMQDGSKATADAMEGLSKETQDMFKQFNAGELTVAEMSQQVAKDLESIDNQVDRNIIGVGLFGTKWEDLGGDVVTSMLKSGQAMTDFKGSTEEAGKSMQDNFDAKLKKTMRTAQAALLPVGIILLDLANEWLPKIASAIEFVANAFAGMPTSMQGMLIGGAALIALLGPMLVLFGAMASGMGAFTSSIGGMVKMLGLLSGRLTRMPGLFSRMGRAAAAAQAANAVASATPNAGGGRGRRNQGAGGGGSKLGKIAKGAVKGVGGAMKGVTGVIAKAGAMFLPLLATPMGLAITAVIAVVAGGIYLIVKHWDTLKAGTIKVFKGIGGFFKKWGPEILAILSGPIVMLVTLFIKHWDKIKAATSQFLSFIGKIFTDTFNRVKSNTEAVFRAISAFLQAIWNSLKAYFTQVLNSIRSVFTSVWNAIKSFLTSVMNGIKSTIQSVWNSIKGFLSSVMTGIKNVITSVWNSIKSFLSTVMNGIKGILVSAWNAIKSVVTTAVNAIKGAVTRAFNGMKSAASTAAGAIKNTLVGAFNTVKNVASTAFGSIKTTISKAFSGIKNIAKDAWSWGSDIVSGLIGGITGRLKDVKDTAKKLGNSVSKTVKKLLGIKSPSRVMRGFGVNVAQGLAIGIDKAKGFVERASRGMVGAIRTPDAMEVPVSASISKANPNQTFKPQDPQEGQGPDKKGTTGSGGDGVIIQNAQFTIEVEKLQSADDIKQLRKSIQNVVADDLFGMAVRNV